jgi:hypothetical protein
VADDWELEQIANSGRSFLLAGATPLGHVNPGYTAVFRLDPEEAAERYAAATAERPALADLAVFEGGWERSGPAWRLRGAGVIRLPGEADPGLARVCASDAALVVHRPGLPPARLASGACADALLLPGSAGRLEVVAAQGDPASVRAVEVLPLRAIRSQDLLSTAYMVPQVARVAGEDGRFWQTDLVLVNPQTHALRLTGLFLRSGLDNRAAYAATTVVPAGAVLELRDVLRNGAFERLGGRGALLVYGGDPKKPCAASECRFLLCARTHNSLVARGSAASAEWLPGLPAAAAMGGGRATFEDVIGGKDARASVGLASWSDRPLRVRVLAAPSKGDRVVREATLPPFGHLRVDLGAWPAEGNVEVDLRDRSANARLFPYLSVVDGATGTTRHLLPEAISIHPSAASPPMPRPLSGELTRGL